MKTLFTFFLVLITLTNFAQSNLSFIAEDDGAFGTNYEGFWIKESSTNKQVKGNPYLLENWNSMAIIFSTSGEKYKISNLNFDTTRETFVVKMQKDSVFVFDSSYIQKVILNGKIYKSYIKNGENIFYQEVVVSAKGLGFLKKSIKKIKKGSKVDLFTDSNEKYVLKTYYYIKKDDKIQKLKPKNKYFLKSSFSIV